MGKNIAIHLPDRAISKILSNTIKINNNNKKKPEQVSQEKGKDLNRHFSKEEIQMDNKYMQKMPNTPSYQENPKQQCQIICITLPL